MIFVKLFKFVLNFMYVFLKTLKTKKRVLFLSRQSNNTSINYKFLNDELKKMGIETKIINKKIEYKPIKLIIYFFVIIYQMYYISTSKIIIIDGYSIPISLLKHKKENIIIQMWHADFIVKKIGLQILNKKTKFKKKLALNMNMHKNYDYVISSMEKTSKTYQKAFDINKNQILEFGTPMLDYIYINKNFKIKHKNKLILYAPTKTKNSKIKEEKIKEAFKNSNLKNYELIINLHPTNKNSKKMSEDLIRIADYVITDYSNIIYESYLYNKKTLLYIEDINDYKKTVGLNIDIYNEFKEHCFYNAKELFKYIKLDKYNKKSYDKYFKDKLKYFDGKCTNRIIEFIKIKL